MTIHVRIPIAYSVPTKEWNAAGWSRGTEAAMVDRSLDQLEEAQIVAWIEADVEVPDEFTTQTIQGSAKQ